MKTKQGLTINFAIMQEEIYQLVVKEILRLKEDANLPEIFEKYIYQQLSDQDLLEIIKTDKITSIELPPGLSKPAVLEQTVLLIEALQKCDTWKQFEEQYSPPEKEGIDFDKLIQHLLTIKPPK
ncbi:hypothetical protein [Taibaiella helva]|uniref:hypothetical protein n=1 Tax=Taibaiella helva TaxID=2301235 RepID=UPI0013004887|nr:hypothetical protein [Taibaiella helva]